jgi:arylsulfatase A-like enzyme
LIIFDPKLNLFKSDAYIFMQQSRIKAATPTLAEVLKPLGYMNGQFGKNHLGDRNDSLPTVHGFDEFSVIYII